MGDLSVSTSEGALHLAEDPAGEGVLQPLAGHGSEVRLRHVLVVQNGTREQTVAGNDLGSVNLGPPAQADPLVERMTYEDADVLVEPLTPEYDVFVRVGEGGVGTLNLAAGPSELQWLGHLYEPYMFFVVNPSADYGFSSTLADASAVILRNDENRSDTFSASPERLGVSATGDVVVLVMGARVTVRDASGDHTFTTGVSERDVSGAAAVHRERRTEFVVLELSQGQLAGTVATDEMRFFAEEALFTVDGTMGLGPATGRLDGRTLTEDSATLRGVLTASVSLAHAPEVDPSAAHPPVSVADDGVTSRLVVDGDYDVVVLNGQDVAAPVAAGLSSPEKVAVGLGLGAVLLGALVAAKKFLLPALGLFARPEPLHPMLENPLRMRLHGLVTAYPGIHGRRLQSLAQVATGTFEHHMRSLLHADLVREERIGGRVVYVPCEPNSPKPKVDRDELAVRALLMTEARRRVAEAVAQSPKTQRELVEGLALPQQTVSFHVKALLDHKVLVAGDGRPAVYSVNPEYLALITGSSALGEQQGILSKVLRRVRGGPATSEASAAS